MAIYAKPRRKLVIFCGAGFSAPFGIPTMAQFAGALRQSGFLSPDDQTDLDRVVNECNSLASVVGSSARNLEQLASFLSILETVRPGFRFAGCGRDMQTPSAVTKKILECCAFLTRPGFPGSHARDATYLIQAAVNSTDLTVVTTNYDLLIEFAGLLGNRRAVPAHPGAVSSVSPGPVLGDREPLYSSEPVDSFKIFKLHGSVNWLRVPAGVGIVDQVQITERSSDQFRAIQNFHLAGFTETDRAAVAMLCRSQERVIIPPTVLKASAFSKAENDIVAAQWEGACTALEQADAIWFIGYSFPETDSFMRYFLGASLADNARLDQVVVINPDRRVIEQRARPLFAAPHHREVFTALPVLWPEVQVDALLQNDMDQAISDYALQDAQKRDAIRAFLWERAGE